MKISIFNGLYKNLSQTASARTYVQRGTAPIFIIIYSSVGYVEVIAMMPPICEICSREFNPDKEGGLIYFKETEEGRAFERRAKVEKNNRSSS